MVAPQTINSVLTSIFGAVVGGSLTAGAALWSLNTTRRLNRARFLYDLHKDFFVEETYKATLDILDEPAGDPKIIGLVETEDSRLIDLLNAFELVAYLVKAKQLKKRDADALLGYYLGCCGRHSMLRQYINNKSNSFENLEALLAESY